MPKIKTRVTFNKTSAIARIKAANNAALTDMGNQALQDVSEHVPIQGGETHDGGGGDLRKSGLTNSDKKAHDGEFILRWDEPYSRYLWHGDVMYGNPTARTYGPKRISFTNALARAEWAKYAKEIYGNDWKRVYQAALKRRLKQ